MGHDLRTPLARLRLRADAIRDDDVREAIGTDIEEMEAMVSSLMAFLGGEGDVEQPELTDLAILCANLPTTPSIMVATSGMKGRIISTVACAASA